MEIMLRGHHLLCVHGFRGMGYSADFVRKMTEVTELIRDKSKTFPIRVVEGLDEACGSCPNKGGGICLASAQSEAHVRELDRRIMEKLRLRHEEVVDKEWLVRHTAETVGPDDLDTLCKGCSWLRYGVCKDGIRLLKESLF